MSEDVDDLSGEVAEDELPPSYYAGLADALISADRVEDALRCIEQAYKAADRLSRGQSLEASEICGVLGLCQFD